MAVTAAVGALLAALAAPAQAEPMPMQEGPFCGEAITKPDGSPWVCTFAEEFDGSALDRDTWVVQTTAASGFNRGGDCVMDSPDNVSVADGTLRLTTRKEAPFECSSPQEDYTSEYTSGTVMTHGTFSQAFGRFEIRAKFPDVKVPGLQGALWLWPDDPGKYGPWPLSGEIDIAEWYSQYPDRVIPFIHYHGKNPYDPSVTNNYCVIDASQFHTYTVVWTESKITITFDGHTCVDHTINPASPLSAPQPFDHPFMIALTQMLGVGANSVTDATPVPATTEVDYVRVWK